MNITVTGVTGDIGGHFLATLPEHHSAKILVRPGVGVVHGKTPTERFEYKDYWTYDANLLRELTDSQVVVHFAGLLRGKTTSLNEYVATNAILTALLLVHAKRNCVRFIYLSSETVYQLEDTSELRLICDRFVKFCHSEITENVQEFRTASLTDKFLAASQDCSLHKYEPYALSKFLGEAVVSQVPDSAILRISNAYGPGYDNPRLIPRLASGRLTGRGAAFTYEQRDFIYNADLNTLIDTLVRAETLQNKVIDCRSGELTDTRKLRDAILRSTPTAYGKLTGRPGDKQPGLKSQIASGDADLATLIGSVTSIDKGLQQTLLYHKEKCYHQMTDSRTLEDFVGDGEKLIKPLQGSSAAYLFVVTDSKGVNKVRKVAIRDGVEGNGIAKLNNEISYYRHISRQRPELARLYAKLLDARRGRESSSETLEYLNGDNFYASLRKTQNAGDAHRQALSDLITSLCSPAICETSAIRQPDQYLDTYYLERALSRLKPIENIIPKRGHIQINGRKLLAPHVILSRMLSDPDIRKPFLPRAKAFCFHGDLTLLNTVYVKATNTIRLIDPRGYTGTWDPLYDFGKMKLTLGGFGELIMSEEQMVSGSRAGFSIDFDRSPPAVRDMDGEFFDILENNQAFQSKIAAVEPYWRQRIRLATASHFLADIPFRMYIDNTTYSAVAPYVIGTHYLNQIFEELHA